MLSYDPDLYIKLTVQHSRIQDTKVTKGNCTFRSLSGLTRSKDLDCDAPGIGRQRKLIGDVTGSKFRLTCYIYSIE